LLNIFSFSFNKANINNVFLFSNRGTSLRGYSTNVLRKFTSIEKQGLIA